MKKLLVLVIILIFTIGCSYDPVEEPMPTIIVDIPSLRPESDILLINMYTLDNNISLFEYRDNEEKFSEANLLWNDLLNDKFGIEINNINIYTEYNGWIKDLNSLTLPTLFKMGYDNGIYFLDYDTFCNLSNANLLNSYFTSLDSLYESNPLLADIPNEYTGLTTDLKGVTWGLAFDYNDNQLAGRYYQSEVLESANLEAPETINEFYETCVILKRQYPDKYVINKNYNDINILYNFSDILNAYGIYGNRKNDWFESIQYNYSTDSFEDLMLSSNLRESLEFIRSLKSINIIRTSNLYSAKDNFLSNEMLSYYSQVFESNKEDIGLKFIPYLQKKGIEPIYKYNKTSKIMLIAKNLKDADEVVGRLMEIIQNNSQYLDLRYGSEYEILAFSSGQIAKYNERNLQYPNIIGVFNDRGYSHYSVQKNGPINGFIDREEEIINITNTDNFNRILKPVSFLDYAVSEPVYPSSTGYRWTNQVFTEVFANVFDLSISLDDLYDEYFKKIGVIGGEKYLEYINTKAGKTQRYFYD